MKKSFWQLWNEVEIPHHSNTNTPLSNTNYEDFENLFNRFSEEEIVRALKVGVSMNFQNVKKLEPLITDTSIKQNFKEWLFLIKQWIRNDKSIGIINLSNMIYNTLQELETHIDEQENNQTIRILQAIEELVNSIYNINDKSYYLAFTCLTYYCVLRASQANESNNISLPYTGRDISQAIQYELLHNPENINIQPDKYSYTRDSIQNIQSVCEKNNFTYLDIEYFLQYGKDTLDIDIYSANSNGTFTLFMSRLNPGYSSFYPNQNEQNFNNFKEMVNFIAKNKILKDKLKILICRNLRN